MTRHPEHWQHAAQLESAQWGSVADWAMVAVTLGALVAAVLLYLTSRRQVRLLQEESERSQASRVLVWVHSIQTAPTHARPSGNFTGAVATLRLCLHNGGDEPAFDLDVNIGLPGFPVQTFRKRLLPPDGRRRLPQVDVRTDNPDMAEVQLYPNSAQLEIKWRDAAGRTWERLSDGSLQRWSGE